MKISNQSMWAAGCLIAVCLLPQCGFAQSVPNPPAPKSPIARFEAHIELLQREIDELAETTIEQEAKLDEREIPVESYAEVLGSLQSQRIHLMIELAGLEARQLMADKIWAEQTRGSDSPVGKKILETASEKLATAKQELARKKQLMETGSVSQQDYSRSRNSVLNAELELLQAQQELETSSSRSTFAETLAIETSVAQAEAKAKLKMVENLLERFVAARKELDSFQRAEMQLEHKRDALSEWQRRLQDLKQAAWDESLRQ